MKRKIKAYKEVSKYDIVIITGASSGIGECFANFVIEAMNAHNKDAKIFNISRTPAQIKSPIFTNIACDLTSLNALNSAVCQIKDTIASYSKAPKILLINNSGFGAYGHFPAPNIQRNLQMIDLNIRALTALCGEFLTEIKAGNGSIINIASTASFQACPQLSVYAASKSYVKSFTIALSQEIKQHNCKCLCVCPGPTSSMFFKSAGFDDAPLPSGFGHKPIDVVLKAFNALYANKKMIIVGKLNTLQAIITSFIPECIMVRISAFILGKIRKT